MTTARWESESLSVWLLPVIAALVLPKLASGVDLDGVEVPRDKFVVYLVVGHSNVAGRS